MKKRKMSMSLLPVIAFFMLLMPPCGLFCELPKAKPDTSQYSAVFDEIWQKLKDNFYDPKFSDADLYGIRTKYSEMATQAKSMDELENVINRMLAELKTSNTRFYTKNSPDYYNILDTSRVPSVMEDIRKIFDDGRVSYTGIGVFTKTINGREFVRAVLEGGPAYRAGLKIGDQIISVDGVPYHPIKSFIGKAEKDVKIKIQSTPDVSSVKEVTVTPVDIKPKEIFWDAMKGSIKILEREGVRIGYIHIWSYYGEQYYQLLMSEIAFGRLKGADALIVDLRNGWGGASPYYLNIFHKNVPVITQIDRDGIKTVTDYQWRNPVVMLVNEETRGGDEIIAYSFKKYGLGKVMGSKTAGTVMETKPFVLKDGGLLNIAVANVLADGESLEGKGVTPDVDINMPLEYANGKDSQMEWAINILFAEVMNRRR